MTRYTPPTKVRTMEIPYKVMVLRADPGFEAARIKEPFYEFTGRTFYGDNRKRGAYGAEPNDD